MNGDAFRMILASAGADPWGGSDVGHLVRNSRALTAAFRLARSNGLNYTLLSFLTRLGIALPPSEIARWASVLEARRKFLGTIRFLNEVAERSGLEYIMIKDCSTVDHVPRDVDVLVRGDERSWFLHALLESGMDIVHDGPAETSLQGNGLMRIDVYARIRYFGRDFLDVGFLWKSQRTATTCGIGHPGLSPEAAYLLNSVHGLFGHRRLTLLDFLDLMNLEARVADLSRCRSEAQACGWGRTFDFLRARYLELQSQVQNGSKMFAFPHRFETRFVLRCLSNLDDPSLGVWGRMAFGMSLAWDDVMFLIETSGLGERLKHSSFGSRLGNAMGHRLRAARGDRKGFGEGSPLEDTRRDAG